MKPSVFEELITKGTERRMAISRDRRRGYANDDDCLVNFTTMAKLLVVAGLVPLDCPMGNPDGSGVAAFFVMHKIQRRFNLMRKRIDIHKAGERKIDTDDDTHNYLDLMLACEIDEESRAVKEA